MSLCKDCDAEILYGEKPDGTRIAVDREPRSDGALAMLGRGTRMPPLIIPDHWVDGAVQHLDAETMAAITYMPHSASCVGAQRHRERRDRTEAESAD